MGELGRRRWWRIVRRVTLALIIVVLVLVFGVLPYMFARLITGAGTRSMDRALTQAPADFGVPYREVEFDTADGITLSGWFVPAEQGQPVIVYAHGLFRSRRELLDRAMVLHGSGFGALLYDSRNHGESGPAMVSLGYHERLDVLAAVRFARETVGSETPIVLFGISMGAVSALLASSETEEVAAVISDSAFRSFRDTTDHHIRRFLRIPAFPIANEIRFFIEWRADFKGELLDIERAVRKLGDRPVLFIAGANDPRMPPDIARDLRSLSSSESSDLLVVDGPGSEVHGHAYRVAPEEYIERVHGFIQSALGKRTIERPAK